MRIRTRRRNGAFPSSGPWLAFAVTVLLTHLPRISTRKLSSSTTSLALKRQVEKERRRIVQERNADRREWQRRLHLQSSQWNATLMTEASSRSTHREGRHVHQLGRRISIECQTVPLFKCPDCYDALMKEQRSVLAALQLEYPDLVLIESTHKLLNMLFVEIPTMKAVNSVDNNDDYAVLHQYILGIPGVHKVGPSEEYTLMEMLLPAIDAPPAPRSNGTSSNGTSSLPNATLSLYSKPLQDIGVDVAAQEYCVTGQGVRIAVCDGGVDYTHVALGGPGTVPAFQAAFGTSIDDVLNQQRDGLFPTQVVTEGRDFLGDLFREGNPSFEAVEDDDPIDLTGHGTAVAHAIRAVAPKAEIIAVKICTTSGNSCPDFSFVRGMEYILDPNQDGDMSDAVHIVNLSLGRVYASNYYSVLARATEELLDFGVLPVLAAGNNGNLPFILGGAPATPNALTVGATVVVDDSDGSEHGTHPRTMASYSSRGPGESNIAKPDMVAPGGPYGLAKASTGDLYFRFEGTSFAAPLVTGAAALLKEKCPECSPFAIKAMLMNHATHTVRYSLDNNNTTAPVTLQGSGELQVHRSLAATFWAYCLDPPNPAMSLGLITASRNVTIQRTIRIAPLNDEVDTIRLGYQFRSSVNTSSAVTIRFLPEEIVQLNGICGQEYLITVEFSIDASKAPSNHMSSTGAAGNDPTTLDANEVDGWIILSSDVMETEVSLPFHMILRKAADVTVQTATFDSESLDMTRVPTKLSVGLQNLGADTAQIDIFQLLYASDDVPESDYGINAPPADLRYVGYRVLPVRLPGCTALLEFAVTTWESQSTISYTHFNVWIDTNFDGTSEQTVFNSGFRLGSAQNEMRRIDLIDGTEYCVKYPPDHGTNTANTVLRFCTDDIGIVVDNEGSGGGGDTVISVAVSSYSFPEIAVLDAMEYRNITISMAGLSAPSYDLRPRAALDQIQVSGTGTTTNVDEPMGLLLFTNSYRSPTQTGSSTKASESIVIVREGIVLPQENTKDVLVYPIPKDTVGPSCATWPSAFSSCFGRRLNSVLASAAATSMARIDSDMAISHFDIFSRHLQAKTACPEFPLQRSNVTTIERDPTTILIASLPTPSPDDGNARGATSGPPSTSLRVDDSAVVSSGAGRSVGKDTLCLGLPLVIALACV